MHPFLNVAEKAVIKAGKIIVSSLDHLNRLKVTEKTANDYLTFFSMLTRDFNKGKLAMS